MTLPTKILVPTDFSESAEAAVAYAVDLAEKVGAKVCILHVYELPLVQYPDVSAGFSAELVNDLERWSQEGVGELVAKYQGRGVELTTRVTCGDAREHVLEVARVEQADLVCMGTHGRRGVSRWLIGSVAESVVRTSPVPVLTIRIPKK